MILIDSEVAFDEIPVFLIIGSRVSWSVVIYLSYFIQCFVLPILLRSCICLLWVFAYVARISHVVLWQGSFIFHAVFMFLHSGLSVLGFPAGLLMMLVCAFRFLGVVRGVFRALVISLP